MIGVRDTITKKSDIGALVVIIIVAAAFLFSVPSLGNFPLSDDPYYSQMVFNFLQGNFVFDISPVAATTVLHAMYGWVFSIVAGPFLQGLGPHAVLRISTMVLSLLYIVAVFLFGRLLKLSTLESLALSLLLLTNPIFYNISHAFMTDITFSFFFLLALIFYLKGMPLPPERGNLHSLVVGSIFASAAILVRQWGVALPLGAAIALCIQRKNQLPRPPNPPSVKKELLAILIVPAVTFVLGMYWFYVIMDGLSSYFFVLKGPQYGIRFSMIALNLSFYLFPFVILPLLGARMPRRPLVFVATILATVPFVVYDHLKHGWIFPFIQNSFGQSGAGPVYMAPILTGEARQLAFDVPTLSLFLVASLLLLAYSISNMDVKNLAKERKPFLLLLMVLPYSLAMFVTSIFFDRYLIPVLPLFFFFAIKHSRGHKWRNAALVLTIFVMGYLSLCHNYTYLSLQQANRDGINFLLSRGVPREKIDGGIEFCTQNRFGRLIPLGTVSKGSVSGWCEGDDYVTSLEPIPGYATMKTIGYNDRFGNSAGHVFVLEKSGLSG